MNIALFTIAVGKDPVYFDSVRRYFPYNKKYFGQDHEVDYFLFTDRDETIEGITNIPCVTTLWPYTTLLKNNLIRDYLDSIQGWERYDSVFFIDADFAIGDTYDFFSPPFILVKPYWNEKNGGGFFYGGHSGYFRKLCNLYYNELQFIYENKLSLPRDLDEYYLGLFREKYPNRIHVIEMDRKTNTGVFYDNEDLDQKIAEQGKRLFLQPYKAKGRANKTMIRDISGKEQECIVNLKEQYLFNNYTYDFGRLVSIDDTNFQILWAKQPEKREVLNIETFRITHNVVAGKTNYPSPVISVVMPVYNTRIDYLNESIESILNQTFTDFELIIVDDGSTEVSCIECIRSYEDLRIRLIENHHDFIDSLNRGIKESRGRYIARMDSDDRMTPDRLEVQYEFMEEHPEIAICGSWAEMIGMKTGIIKSLQEQEDIITSMLLHNPMVHPTVFFRQEALGEAKTNGLYKQGYPCAEDYQLWTEMVLRGMPIANIPQVLLYYRMSENQVTYREKKEMTQSTLTIRMEYAEAVMEQIVEQTGNYQDFFNALIDLYNNQLIDYTHFLNMVSQIYKENIKTLF